MDDSLEVRASALVNPKSGVANDYLNHFNEILLLIENLPVLLPDMIDEIMAWRPVSYREYFTHSPLPGSAAALEVYETLNEDFKQDFEGMVRLLDSMILHSIKIIASNRKEDGMIDADEIGEVCERISAELRVILDRTANLVNHGDAPPLERAQCMADRILASPPQEQCG